MLSGWKNNERKPKNGIIITCLQQQNVILQPNKSKSREYKTKLTPRKIVTSPIDESKGFREKVKAKILQYQKVDKLFNEEMRECSKKRSFKPKAGKKKNKIKIQIYRNRG